MRCRRTFSNANHKRGFFMKHFILFVLAGFSIFLLPSCCTTCCSETKQENKSGIVTTNSGLKYEILSAGAQEKTPYPNAKVTVHYTGYLQNADGTLGKKFDSSVDRGTPFPFFIGQKRVILGWDEGVMSMKIGEKRRLIIPPHLGYGSRGAPGVIPPNSTLIFDVELIKVD